MSIKFELEYLAYERKHLVGAYADGWALIGLDKDKECRFMRGMGSTTDPKMDRRSAEIYAANLNDMAAPRNSLH